MTLQQFINEYNGKTNVTLPGFPATEGQCVALAALYAEQVVGAKLPGVQFASQYWTEATPGYEKIPATDGYPIAGDIVVFNSNLPGSEGAGHVDVCIRNGSSSGFLGLDQNWSPSRVTEVQHNYEYVLGWLRHEAAKPTPPASHSGTATVERAVFVRSAPNTSAPLAGSKELFPGNTFEYKAIVSGQDVNENGVHTNKWLESEFNHYVWLGNCKL